jgi:type VI secretion system protein ImpE
MTALEHFQEGRLGEALASQHQAVLARPADAAARLLLCELLLFNGELDSLLQHLDRLPVERVGMEEYLQAYRALIAGEQWRQRVQREGRPSLLLEPSEAMVFRMNALEAIQNGELYDATEWLDEADACTPWITGHVDGRAFDGFRDTDDLFGPTLELILDNQYAWFPAEEVRRLRIGTMESLRDLYFVPALLTARNGEEWHVHLPALYAGTHGSEDEEMRSGLASDWVGGGEGPIRGVGMRILGVGEEELSIRDFTQWEG